MFFVIVSKTKNEFGQNPQENIIWTGPGLYTHTVIWTGSLTKTNRENINVKYNIDKYMLCGCPIYNLSLQISH